MSRIGALLGRGNRPAASLVDESIIVPEQFGRPYSVVVWALVTWTALSGITLLLIEGTFSRAVAGGLRDHAGQRVFGVALVLVTAGYALTALRGRADPLLSWLPFCGQGLTVLVLSYNVLSGSRSLESSLLELIVAAGFLLLLTAFRLAGGPTRRRDGRRARARTDIPLERTERWQVTHHADPRTERLAPLPDPEADAVIYQPRPEPPEDETPLGI